MMSSPQFQDPNLGWYCQWRKSMITLTTDEVVLIKTILTALRGIKVRDIDRALVILSKNDPSRGEGTEQSSSAEEA
jgi:hypothetical protein